jgi:hypothetical protein
MENIFSFHAVVMQYDGKKAFPAPSVDTRWKTHAPALCNSPKGCTKLLRGIMRTGSGRSGCVHAPDGNGIDVPREKLACGPILYIITAIGISCPEQSKWMN